jgi:predicted DsbA family dithiol-disulfide isomerase
MMTDDRPLEVDVISDVVCPWCFIGKRRLEAALAELARKRPDVRPVVRWHPFELDPDVPHGGVPRKAYREAKFGGPERTAAIHARLSAVGESVGIAFDFDAIAVQPSTLDAHRLIAWAQSRGDAGGLVERLFAAFFVEGRDIADRSELARLAAEAGIDADAAAAMLASDEKAADVRQMERRALEIGVSGVPFFIFGGRVAAAGAQEPSTLLDAIEGALAPAV